MATVETISACENVCRDFWVWFPTFMSVAANVATVFAVVYGFCQWQQWKRQTISLSAHTVAHQALDALGEYERHLGAARLPYTGNMDNFTERDFEEILKLLREARCFWVDTRKHCIRLVDLGLNDQAKDAAGKLITGGLARATAYCNDARSGFERGDKEFMLQKLQMFFGSPGDETDLDTRIEKEVGELREILRKIIQIQG